jgi:hypothetical protein
LSTMFDRIASRKKKLVSAADKLKAHFVGIDHVIDRIMKNIEAWYCMPELMSRPTICCLWGLTGIGKTDLVRRLVTYLELTDSFVEIQMTNKGSSQHYSSTLQRLLQSSNLGPEDTGVLLLDEIQRFRSVNEDGKEIHDYNFQDLWMMLSDGSFGSASDNKQEVMEMLLDAIYYDDLSRSVKRKEGKDENEVVEDDKHRRYKQSFYSAKQMKRRLKLSESFEEIMKWSSAKKTEVITEKMADKTIYAPEVYQKLLIFVSGNIDEAYQMSDKADEVSVDADIFHKHSLSINAITIKKALGKRFKPEQIARFGNNHVIYPALSKKTYEGIIRRRVTDICESIYKNSGVEVLVDESVYEAIYRNGVFPVQGTRPVFSTISSLFEALMPQFVMAAIQNDQRKISVSYKDKHLCSKIGGETVCVFNEGDIDKIKEDKRDPDLVCKVSVHEAGHAVVYSDQFRVAPTQIVVNIASEDANGFVYLHNSHISKTTLRQRVMSLLAGRAAEELVFGDENVSTGAVGDLKSATFLATCYFRDYGMGTTLCKTVAPSSSNADSYCTDIEESNREAEEFLQECMEEAKSIIENRKHLIIELAEHLMTHSSIDFDQYSVMTAKHGLEVSYVDAKDTLIPRFKNQFDKFLALDKGR